MRAWRLARGPYWLAVVILIVAKFAFLASIEFFPQMVSIVRNIDTPIVVVLAFVVAARFADAGWRRWPAFVLIILISFVLPLVILLASNPLPRGPNPLDDMPDLLWLSTAALFALLIVAGVKRSVAPAPAAGASTAGRIEPTV